MVYAVSDIHGCEVCRRGMWMDIDCGCVFSGGRPGRLCLDTLEEIYI